MKGKFRKLFLSLLMIGGVVGLTSCEKASHTAEVPAENCEVRIMDEKDEHGQIKNRYALVTLGIKNDTIYNITSVDLTYDVYTIGIEQPVYTDTVNVVLPTIRHGASGYLTYTVNGLQEYPAANYIKITKAKVATYQTLWQTYMAPFIVMIIFASISLIFFAFEIFKGGLTREAVKDMLKERIATSAVILGLVLLICLIPLMFSSWVTTLILVGGVCGTGVLCGLLTLLRMAFIKND